MKKTVLCGLLLASLMASALPAAHGAEGGFTDVPQTAWYYDSVTAMSAEGLLLGVGDGSFAPSAPMSRAAYITIAVRVAYPDELANAPAGDNWWDAAHRVALEKGLLWEVDPGMSASAEDMSQPITREEMALILARTAKAKGVTAAFDLNSNAIPDYKRIAVRCKRSVRNCYALGLLNGADEEGNFRPQDTLDRASACQGFYKLLNEDKRTPINPFKNYSEYNNFSVLEPAEELQTWVEGERHTIPQAGDTVIKADGTKVVLEEVTLSTGWKILGFGQGVDIITGTQTNPSSDYLKKVGDHAWYDGDKSKFIKFDVTGEVYTEMQWLEISKAMRPDKNTIKGTYDGETYGDYFVWDSWLQDWCFRVSIN